MAEVEAAAAELAALLGPGAAPAVRAAAAEAALALSGDAAGRRLLAGRPEALAALAGLAAGPGPAGRSALGCLLNASAEPQARDPLLAALPELLPLLPAGPACGLLANLCREPGAGLRVLRGLRDSPTGLDALYKALGEPRPPPELGPLLCNLSQLPEGREMLLDRSRRWVQRLLPLVQPPHPATQRRGAAGALRNCCFQSEAHEWLLGQEVDILPSLLLPLAGPEELPEDEMEALPPDLQYLPRDKQREPEPDIRRMLLEAIMLLTATRQGRRLVRARGTYLVLRELHPREPWPDVLAAAEGLIQVLIGDEPPLGMENLLEVTIPQELEQQLRRLDHEEEEQRGGDDPPAPPPPPPGGGGGAGGSSSPHCSS